MTLFQDAFISIRDFFEAGGNVLWAILFVTMIMWTLIIERVWYLYGVMPKTVKRVVEEWDSRKDTTSWYAKRIRDMMISEVSVEARQYLLASM